MAHVDGRAEQVDGALDDVDGSIDPGAESTRIGEKYCIRFPPRIEQCVQQEKRGATVIAESATLNAGKYADSNESVEIDDMTQSDPVDHVAERAAEHQASRASRKLAPRGSRTSQTMMAMLTDTASPMNTHRCQPEARPETEGRATLCMRVISRTAAPRELEFAYGG